MFTQAELQAKARKYIFERKGKAFDISYADMRAKERRKMVNLFREAVNSDQLLFKRYAEAALPALMRELFLSQELANRMGSDAVLLAENHL
ncbi:MAG: hypothetical protein EOP43_06400 [Sphingobacteriaceae bacterium]|nr:MAG: hypothetical protein EOP43_06400 [Sphingobacteriaceae bacterium]